MPKLIDLTGRRFGRLVVIERAPNSAKCDTRWKCQCDCGNVVTVRGHNLKQGITNSCGCSRHDPRPYRKTHGMSRTRLYRIWSLMRNRCECKTARTYPQYGGRGITLCEEWKDPETFFKWAMENGYQENLTIDRIDNDGGYCPENCRWVTMDVQSNNTRNNRFMTINGRTQTLAQWCREYDMGYKMVYNRITNLGWDLEKALTTPVNVSKRNKLSKV